MTTEETTTADGHMDVVLELKPTANGNGVHHAEQSATDDDEKANKEGNGTAAAADATAGREDETDKFSQRVSYFSLYKFGDWLDLLAVLVGGVAAMAHGALTPMMSIILGNVANAFTNPSDLTSTINQMCIWFCVLGIIAFVTTFFQTWCFIWSGERQANRIRRLFFRAIMRQDIGWFDVHDSTTVTTRVASDVLLIQDAISEQVGTFLQFFSQFLVGIIVGFVYGWQMTLVVLSLMPVMFAAGAVVSKLTSKHVARAQTAQSLAGAVAEEVFSSVRTVMAFGGENTEIDRYQKALRVATKSSNKKANIQGAGIGLVYFIAFSSFGLAFYYGSVLVQNGTMTPGAVFTVFFSVVIGATGIGQAAPSLAAFAQGTGAAAMIFEVIAHEPEIDVMAETGKKPEQVSAHIKFNDVHFSYPSRVDVPILQGLSLDMPSNQTIALVGLSGSGKSTIVALLERFYDPSKGSITLDGIDTKELNLKWLRSKIALVQQEPILFATTIGQNIALGALHDDVSQAEIEEAAKQANAHDFISSLPNKYDTMVGERGVQLSGGQKQRIAIARALVKQPSILLLDEATSALDSGSERVVQEALDRARQGRTTIVIAHRLSTIRDADQICVMVKGKLVEQGTHASLVAKGELYASLVATQQVSINGSEQSAAASTANLDEKKGDDADEELKKKVAAGVALAPAAKDDDKEEAAAVEPTAEEKVKGQNALRRAFALHRPDWYLVMCGLIGAAGHGAMLPVFTIIFSRMLNILVEMGLPELFDINDLRSQADMWAGMFVVLAFGSGVFNYMQMSALTIGGDRLVERLRSMLFSSVMKQDLSWFDKPANDVGRLTTKLASDAILVESATGMRWGIFAEITTSLVVGVIVAMTSSWKVSLVVLACLPILFFGGVARTKLRAGFSHKTKKAFESAGQLASECVNAMRTVASLGREETFISKYQVSVEQASGTVLNGVASSLGFAFSELFSMPIWALAFWYGAQLVANGEIDFGQLLNALMAIIFGGVSIGRLSAVAPNYGKAQIAAKDLFEIIDHQPSIDTLAEKGTKPESIEGNIKFEGLMFNYPARPEVTVLSDLTLTVPAGKTVALVGQSGCGKSTTISLLERFYEQAAGSVTVDGHDTREVNVHWLRQQLGLVSQEPTLFARSIKENIRYGRPDANDDDIIAVAKEANIHNFIMTLPKTYDTFVGEKGTQLSGGQKQRVAIARALLRKPKILLLDEATSALDSESEHLVQAALEVAMKGRTTILIAHRLSTVIGADIIAVVHKGVVVEQGTHNELLAKRGKYFELVQNQVNPV